MKTVCEPDKCCGCMACIDSCPQDAIKIRDTLRAYNAVIDESRCMGCNLCYRICQNNSDIQLNDPIKWYQGWASDSDLRKRCASGGLATAISKAFISRGGSVCSCEFRNGRFVFGFADDISESEKFIGSKYVKSDPTGMYRLLKDKLKNGERILFIGLPCQSAAVQKYVGSDLKKGLYTIDLICHGTPSPKLLERFLSQYKLELSDLKDIKFREKAKFQLYGDHRSIITRGVSDRYSIAFLNAISYTENCYNCKYARTERVSDLTLGDSWGSDLNVEERDRGVSLILCQTQKGFELIENSNVNCYDVDIQNAIDNNHQLKYPSTMPKDRDEFFIYISKGGGFNKLVKKFFLKQCIRQDIKEVDYIVNIMA